MIHLLVDATVLTQDDSLPVAQALAVKDGPSWRWAASTRSSGCAPSARWRCSGPIAARPTAWRSCSAYTIDAARAAGLEADRGALVSGKRADFLVLSANPLECPADAIKDVRVLQTWVEGSPILVRP